MESKEEYGGNLRDQIWLFHFILDLINDSSLLQNDLHQMGIVLMFSSNGSFNVPIL